MIALRRGDDAAAIRHFERALAADERTARTVEALREVRRWRAALAWADALGQAPTKRSPPALELLDSRVPDAAGTRRAARDALLRDEVALDYELYEWWRALRAGGADELASHYASDAVRERTVAAALPDWERVDRELAFAARDAVAVLRWHEGDERVGRLLLLRAVGDRWLIYRENPL